MITMLRIISPASQIGKGWLAKAQSFNTTKMFMPYSSSAVLKMAKAQRMPQVEVDEVDVKQKLGDIQMAFVKKAESRNKVRASRHVFYRKKDWVIGSVCICIALSIYAYTIFAMKQETFLDDFEMPDPLQEDEKKGQ